MRYHDPIVKRFQIRTAILLILLIFKSSPAFCADEPPPPIDAQRFDVTPLKKSKSGKIYLFKSSQVVPKTGNLILIYDQAKPAMAFRVLKNDPPDQQFVAKRVRRYDQTGELNLNQPYSSIEKIADVLPPPPSPPPQPAPTSADSNLNVPTPSDEAPTTNNSESTPTSSGDQGGAPPAEDQELDSPEVLDELDQEYGTEEEYVEPLTADESERMNPFNNILSVTAGYFGNASNFSFSPIYNNGFSVSYAHKVFNDVFIKQNFPQDAIFLEVGGIYYRIINRDGGNDIYTMFPFYGNLLYQLYFSNYFALTLEGGLQYNFMSSAVNPGRSLDDLQGVQANGGLGVFFTIGPQWMIRISAGFDRIAGGLSIKW